MPSWSSRSLLIAVILTLLIVAVTARQPGSSTVVAAASASAQGPTEQSDSGSASVDATPSAEAASVSPIGEAPPSPTTCQPADQDRYVYHPARLEVLAACIRVTGTVAAVRHEADGDLHILVALDPADSHLLTAANQGKERGDLVVEPVCVRSVSQADAIATCAIDPDPFAGALPVVGQAVWMEGRYVLDLQHGGWAELHPLYRWGGR